MLSLLVSAFQRQPFCNRLRSVFRHHRQTPAPCFEATIRRFESLSKALQRCCSSVELFCLASPLRVRFVARDGSMAIDGCTSSTTVLQCLQTNDGELCGVRRSYFADRLRPSRPINRSGVITESAPGHFFL